MSLSSHLLTLLLQKITSVVFFNLILSYGAYLFIDFPDYENGDCNSIVIKRNRQYSHKLNHLYLFIVWETPNGFMMKISLKYVFLCFQRHFNASVGWFSYWRRCSGKSLYSHYSWVNSEPKWGTGLMVAGLDSLHNTWLAVMLFSHWCRVKFSIIVTQQEVLVPRVSMTTAGTPAQVTFVELAV